MPQLDIVVFQAGKAWGAQCLQHDIGAQGSTLLDVLYEMQRALVGHVAVCRQLNMKPFEGFAAAPQEYWDMWSDSVKVEPELAPFSMPTPEARPRPEFRLHA